MNGKTWNGTHKDNMGENKSISAEETCNLGIVGGNEV
jgi:hypothetical protein